MTDRWTEQQLQHFARVRAGLMKSGFARDVAEAQARRAVEARASQRPRKRHSDEPTKDELYHEAMRYNITGRSKMDKSQLANAVEGHRNRARGQ
jgi:hypothetical protein